MEKVISVGYHMGQIYFDTMSKYKNTIILYKDGISTGLIDLDFATLKYYFTDDKGQKFYKLYVKE